MKRGDDDRFQPKLGRLRDIREQSVPRFISRVVRATNIAGARKKSPARQAKRLSQRHRGAVSMRLLAKAFSPRARRVLIKSRIVRIRGASARSTQKHLRYIERDGVTKDGTPAQAYGPSADAMDTNAFEARGREDRHQFRFIVSPEDAIELEDLRTYTRDLMSHMERDLGTRLDWVAVDHWNTDNPHTHIVLRGKDQHQRDLIIAREYISNGMRARASEIATQWLGPRTERQIEAALIKEVSQERWTSLDLALQRETRDDRIELAGKQYLGLRLSERQLRMGRLQHLAAMGLAESNGDGSWNLHKDLETTLRAMGERNDIIRTMQRAFGHAQRELSIHDPSKIDRPIVGKLVAKELADEMYERIRIIIDGLDGKAHSIALPAQCDVSEVAVGSIVRIRSRNGSRAVDKTIADLAKDGAYRVEDHRAVAESPKLTNREIDALLQVHKRRLEALRRAGIVERLDDGTWRIPPDLPTRGREYDAKRFGDIVVDQLNHLSVDQQIRAVGATWLDQQLLRNKDHIGLTGFGEETRSALHQRAAFLVDEGFARYQAGGLSVMPDLLAKLRQRELDQISKSIAKETGLVYRQSVNDARISGTYRQSLMLTSGRFAMIDDGSGFNLVPWRPVIEKKLGRELQGRVCGRNIDWDFSKERGPSI